MVDMTGNDFFEEDDEFFADAFRSISEIETSSLKVSQDSGKQKDELLPTIHQNQLDNSSPEISSSFNKNDVCVIKNSKKSDICLDISLHAENSSFVQDENCYLNQRFLPGYTPRAIKRKFPGPAGILINEPARKVSIGNSDVSKSFETAELELEVIRSSQFSVDELLETVSWKKLQEDVSSNHSFLSTVKHFSVQRVLNDTSKKRLPKHVVVPILCLYIKKFSSEEPVSIYVDDTGEISGKVDKEVLELYKNYIKTGTSLVLKKITFVCNVMLLEKSSLVSIYLDDGTVHHIQNWDTLIEEESSNSLSCIFPVTPKILEKSVRLESLKATPSLKPIPNTSTELVPQSSCRTFLPKNIDNANFNSSPTSHFKNPNANNHQIISADANEDQNISASADLNNPDLEMDDFDELMGNLDETSFLENY